MKNLRFYLKDYCAKTGIHGFQYIGESRTIFEKILWLILLVLSFWASALYIKELNEKRLISPVIVTFSNKPQSLLDIPFPAITICPGAKVNPNIVDAKEIERKIRSQFIEENSDEPLTDKEKAYINHMLAFCWGPSFSDMKEYDFGILSKLLNKSTDVSKALHVIKELKPNFSIDKCTFKSDDIPCDLLFVPIITSEGFCYSFNILRRSEMFTDIVPRYSNYHDHNFSSEFWDLEEGYLNAKIEAAMKRGPHPEVFPTRAALSLNVEDIRITLKIDKNATRDSCRTSSPGYKISIHSPVNFPDLHRNYFRIPYSSDVVASTEPQLMTTSTSLKLYDPELRKCYFQSESKLIFFKVYTRENCKLECLANDTLRMCGCVDFYMPRDNKTRICGLNATSCMKKVQTFGEFSYIGGHLKNVMYAREMNSSCFNCFSSCNEINYRVSISQSSTNTEFLNNPNERKDDYYYAKLSVFFPSDEFIGSERNELYGNSEFIANIGGILGLFTGFSVMTIVEIIYFMSVRFICNTKLYNNWAGRQTDYS